MRRSARIDSNQPKIVEALRKAGAKVQTLAAVGNGVPDLLVGYRGRLVLLEVKNMDGRGDKLTPAEATFHEEWAGYVCTVRNEIEALNAVGIEWGVI